MKTIWRYVRKYWLFALLASAFMVAEVFVDLLQPDMMARIVNEGILGIGNNGVSDLPLILSTGLRMLLVVIAGGLFGFLSGMFANITGYSCANDLRKGCFSRIMYFSFGQTDRFTTGSLITRITNDVDQVRSLIMQMIRGLVRCAMFFVGGTMALLRLDLSFGVIVACALPLILIDIIFVVWRTNPLFLLLQQCLDRLNSMIQEDVTGIRVIKAFVQEESEEKRFARANQDLVNTQFNVQMMLSFLRPVMNIVLNLAVVGILYVGSVQVRDGSLAPGSVMAAITYISQILNGMMMLAMIFQTISRGATSAKRLEEVLLTEAELHEEIPAADELPAGEDRSPEAVADRNAAAPASETESPAKPGTVVFEHVCFSYGADDGQTPPGKGNREILHDINLSIRPGETFAIIGSTGCGKTSLVNLIPRFYDATQGRVLVNGRDVREYPPEELRERVTVCLQKSELFSTTIRDNIIAGRADASEEEMVRAAESAQAHGFILEQPQGYDTPVAERGMSLSGGQRQRVAIARALLKGGDVMIFDDSTSALDLRTEAALYTALRKDYEGVTKIFIAQRIASVRSADRIAVMDGGRILGVGSHEKLMKFNRVYREIYDSQMREEEQE